MSTFRNYSGLEKVLVGLLVLLIADTILGGSVGLVFRGERHFILLLIFLVSLYLGYKKWGRSSHNQSLSWHAYFLWPFWFFLISLIWVFAVPVSAGGSIKLAVQDAQSLVMLPITSLILYVSQGTKIIQILLKTVVWLAVALALCQVWLWLWLEFFPTPPENYYPYIEAFFINKDSVFVFWQPSATGGYIRIFWISSIWLTLAVFVTPIVARKRWVFLMELILGFAICTSYTPEGYGWVLGR